MYVGTNIYVYIGIYPYMYVCMNVCMNVCIYVFTFSRYMYLCICVCMHIIYVSMLSICVCYLCMFQERATASGTRRQPHSGGTTGTINCGFDLFKVYTNQFLLYINYLSQFN